MQIVINFKKINQKHQFTANFMIKIYKSLKTLGLIALAVTLTNCADDDENRIPNFPESQMSLIHGDSQKSWRLVEVVDDYSDKTDDFFITADCVSDDVYTFKADREVEITYGEVLCFDHLSEGNFTAEHEQFSANLKMIGDPGTIYLSFGRGYANQDYGLVGSTFSNYRLSELSENRMVFTHSNTGILGDYYESYTFVAIEVSE